MCVFLFSKYLYNGSSIYYLIKTDKNESKNMDRKIITIGSPESGEKKFKVEIGNGGLQSQPFCVYAWHEQDALDAAVDYCEQAGWDGLFWDDDESVEEYPDDFVTAGNHSHLLRSDCFHVSQLNETKRNKKNTIRLTESDLKRVISESVKKILSESTEQWWALWLTPTPAAKYNHDTYETEYEETGIAELTLVKATDLESASWIAEDRFYKKYRDSFKVVQYRIARGEDFDNYKNGRRWVQID